MAVEEAGSRPSLGVQACHRGGHSEKCRRGKSLTLLGSVFGGLQVKLKRHVCLRFLSSTTRLPLKMPHHAQHTDVLLLVVARHVTCGMPWRSRAGLQTLSERRNWISTPFFRLPGARRPSQAGAAAGLLWGG